MLQTQAIGRLGKDAEVKEVSGKKVINFSIAVDTGYGDKKKTTWIECGKWGESAGIVQYLTKGTQVHVSGEPSIREWESNGKSGVTFQLNVQQITLVGGKGGDGHNTAAAVNSQQPATPLPELGSGLPF